MKIERVIAGAVLALVVLVAVAAQSGIFNFVAVTGALFGNVAGIDAPDLDHPAMIRRGAAHYDRVCASCHASPDRPDQADALELTPPPPKLFLRIEGWPPEFLFRTVKHGVRNTAMPAWPTQNRDDEVWAMVAFLIVLPTLDVATYRELAGLEQGAESASSLVVPCARCHGSDGRAFADGAFPRLDIQSEPYILSALAAFRDGTRNSGFMQSAVDGLKDEELAALAAHFAGEPSRTSGSPPPLVVKGAPLRRIPACGGCHGPPNTARAEFPSLAGQYQSYLRDQLRLFREGGRGGGPFVQLMHEAAKVLGDDDIGLISRWYSSAGNADASGDPGDK